ncbi:MAG TPA: MarR family winged helix-turn-helix transcriptional regulator [Luteibacter sp.]|uniref:MarR family winged helix-turn-helix transcriptional regulator n=1 Tax=Luteibacter sp. TaxID=1886636 RepID=UPI002C2F3187|nr:MarR family winged helix-turn-helix transcriptional regulator [Luteibacter sp.]HVI55802.1 MarR family winged helix-turn-helix transcriptional regulator [Luteibacter sp.]
MAKTSKKANAPTTVVDKAAADASAFLALACTNTALRRAARRLGNLYDDALAPVGLKATQVGMLADIERLSVADEGRSPTLQDLATKLGLQISAVTHALRPLVRDGLIVLSPDEEDRRAKRASLTTKGVTLLHRALHLWAAANRQVEDVLGSDSANALRTLADYVSSDAFLAAYSGGDDEGGKPS